MTKRALLVLVCALQASAHEDRDRAGRPVCLSVTDAGSDVLTLQIPHRFMLEPDRDDLRLVQALLNQAEPALGVSMRRADGSVLVNLSGTVAGFFTAMQLTWNPRTGTGSGRIASELSSHPKVQVSQSRCP